MRRNVSNYFYLGQNYKKELRLVVVFTLGFTIAFAWRETIFDLSKSFISWLIGSNGAGASAWASVFITLLCLILIFLTTRWLRDKRP